MYFSEPTAVPTSVRCPSPNPFARLKSIALEELAAESVVSLDRKVYSEYHRRLQSLFTSISAKPRIVVACAREYIHRKKRR